MNAPLKNNICLTYIMQGSSTGKLNIGPSLWKQPCVAKAYYPSLRTERQTGKNFMQTLTLPPTHPPAHGSHCRERESDCLAEAAAHSLRLKTPENTFTHQDVLSDVF